MVIKPDRDFEHVISTERLVLSPMKEALQSHVNALNDREHMKFSDQRHRIHTLETQREFIASQDKNFLILEIKRRDGIHFSSVGSLTANLDHHNMVANIGIMILPFYINQGYGQEAWSRLIEHLFERGYHKVEAGTPQEHSSMIHIFISSLMQLEGRRRDAFVMDDHHVSDVMLYGRINGH